MISSQLSIFEHAVVLTPASYEHLVGVAAFVNIALHHANLSVVLFGIVYEAHEAKGA